MYNENCSRMVSTIITALMRKRVARSLVPIWIAGLSIIPLAALAQSVKEVEVTNLPAIQDVHVVNQPASTPSCGPIEIVGVTVAAYAGDLGGPWGASEKCNAEFPGTRMCTLAEARYSRAPFPAIPAPGAWTDPTILGPDARVRDDTCGEWTRTDDENSLVRGRITTPAGGQISSPCNLTLSIACCGRAS